VVWFLKYRVTGLHLEFVPQDKVTELRFGFVTVRDLLCSQWLVLSDLERSSKDQARQHFASRPQDFQWSTTRTEQGICLLTIPVLAEDGSLGQAKQHLPWTSHFLKNSRCNR